MTEITRTNDHVLKVASALQEYLGAGGDASVSLSGTLCSFRVGHPGILMAILAGRQPERPPRRATTELFEAVTRTMQQSHEVCEIARRKRQEARFVRWQREQRVASNAWIDWDMEIDHQA